MAAAPSITPETQIALVSLLLTLWSLGFRSLVPADDMLTLL